MPCLYPPIRPNDTFWVKTEEPHTLYVEECGNPLGVPVLFLHGGPGSGCHADHRRYFDPEGYRIILFDQRGAGRSTPFAHIENNTLWGLVDDIEVIRKHLDVERFVLFGGSFGSTLALAYAQKYPERVLGMIVRGIFLFREEELQWFYQSGARHIYPDYWEDFLHPIPEEERNDLVSAYYKRLTSHDEVLAMSMAKHWAQWEAKTCSLIPDEEIEEEFTNPHAAMSLARLEAHYMHHKGFLREGQLLEDAHLLAGIPGIILHGRYDMVCPLKNAYDLHKAWPHSQLRIIREAGHAASHSPLAGALIHATNEMLHALTKA